MRRKPISRKSNLLAAGSRTNPNLGKVIPLQGLRYNTLVAGKTTALKMFFSPANIQNARSVSVTITAPNNSQISVNWTIRYYLENNWDPDYLYCQVFYFRLDQPYLVGRVKGIDIPRVGRYHFTCKLLDVVSTELEKIEFDQEFLPTKDLCVALSRVWGPPITGEEINEAHKAMYRFSTLMPIRDGLAEIDGPLDGPTKIAGLRYICDFHPYPRDSNFGTLYDKYIIKIHYGIAFRFPDRVKGQFAGERDGGNADPMHNYRNIRFSVCVEVPPLAPMFCQESGHIMGLEPSNSPNWDGGLHSNQMYINQVDTNQGFDIQYNRPFASPARDVMEGILFRDEELRDFHGPPEYTWSFSSWDWEYLRQRLLTYRSTGPS